MAKKRISPTSIFIACEGRNTEPLYFERIAEQVEDDGLLAITIYPDKDTPNPKTDALNLIREAQSKGDEFDEVWVVFDKDGYLFVTAGERSILEGRKQAQLLNSGLGKVYKITKDGQPAPGNPFLHQADAKPQIYSYGHRNPQSLDINPVTGDLWEAEFGPRTCESIPATAPAAETPAQAEKVSLGYC